MLAVRSPQSVVRRVSVLKVSKLAFFSLFLLFYPELDAVEPATDSGLKKVLILDFKNVERDPNYQYLETSITDAIRDMLKEKFAYKDSNREEVLKFAESNMLFPEEFHTQSVAFQMGLLLKQDVVINGAFTIKKGQIVTEVKIFDIGKKKILKKFEVKGPASAELFTSVAKIAERIAEEAKAILPNKDEWQRTGASEDMGVVKLNQVALAGGFSVVPLPTAYSGTLDTTTTLRPSDFASSFAFSLGYSRNEIFKKIFAYGNVGYQGGKKSFAVANNTQTINGSLAFYSLKIGIGYEIPLFQKFYLSPFLGGGYYLGNIVLDYSNLPTKPIAADGSEINEHKITVSAPIVSGGLKIGFQLNSTMRIETTGEYINLFYSGNVAGFVFIGGGITFKM